ncbi:MAG TPA: PAS domain S-box protein [Sedimentisphaerales bacterium]|nr:PAS domain S-box protein [Sedimentisphaerales bacterium]
MRRTGVDIVGDVPWGTHFCQFYQSKQDLLDTLVPYFEAGLKDNEFCMWVTSEPLAVEDARRALKKKVKKLEDYVKKGQIEILDYSQWYSRSGRFDADEVLQGWVRKEKQALENGFDGLRLTGNTFWLQKKDWANFTDYEAVVDSVIGKYRMLALCTYSLDKCTASEILDVVGNHQFAFVKREGKWEVIESTGHKKVRAERERLLKAAEITKEGMLITTADGKIVYANESTDKLFGYAKGELIGQYVPILNAGPRPEKTSRDFIKAVKKHGFWEGEVNNKKKDGAEFTTHAVISTVKNKDGEISNFIWTQCDITEHKRAERALQESRERYRMLVETMNDGLSVLDDKGVITYVNGRYCEMLGYSRDEIIGRPATDFADGDNRRIVGEQLQERRSGKAESYEVTVRGRGGREVTTIVSPRVVLDSAGNFAGSFAVSTDITERKQAEEALQRALEESRQRAAETSALLEGSRAVLASREFSDAARSIFDTCKGLTGATAGYVALLNKDGTENDLVFLDSGGRTCRVDPSLGMPVRGLRAEAYRTGRAVYENDFANSEWMKFMPEGHTSLDNVLFAPLAIEQKVVGLLGLANKPGGFTQNDAQMATAFGELAVVALQNSRVLESLERSEQRFRSVAETASDAIISIDSRGMVILWNRGAEAAFGYSAEEMLGKSAGIIMPERFREAHEKGMERILSTWKSEIIGRTVELAGRRRDGSEFPLELSLATWKAGEEVFFAAIVRDITERKQAEETMRESQRQLSIKNRIAQILLTTADDQMYREVLEVILEAMESKYGIFGYIDEQETLIIPSMTRNIWEQCQVPDKTIVYPREKWGGIWGRALIEKRSLYANEGLHVPKGHVPITNVLVAPIMYGGEAVGLLEAANRATDYGEKDLEFLEGIAGRIAPVLHARLQRDRQEKQRKKAEEALRESEDKYRAIFEQAADSIVLIDAENGELVEFNDTAHENLGYCREEFRTLKISDFEVFESGREVAKHLKRIVSEGAGVFETKHRTKSGQIRDVLVSSRGICIGGRDCILSIWRDITDRKQAEEALKRSEERYALAQHAANIGSWDWDILTGKLTWFEQIEPMFGFGRGQFGATYEAFLECVHPDDRKYVVDSVRACVEEGRDYAIEHRIVWPDGTLHWVSEKGGVIRDETARATRMLGIVQDITKRKQAEEALRKSEEKHRSLVETMNEGLTLTNRSYVLTYVNDSFCEMLGYARQEMLNHHLLEFIEDDYKKLMKKQMARRIKGEAKSYEIGWRAKDGRTIYTLVSPAAFFDADGKFAGSLGAVTDITELKEAELCQQLAGKILHVLNRESEARELIRKIVSLIRKATGFAAVGVRLREKEDFPYFEVNGFSDEFVNKENYLCARDENGRIIRDLKGRPFLECTCGNILSGRTDPSLPFFTEGGSFWTNSTTNLLKTTTPADWQVNTRNRCNQAGYESLALIPLRSGEQIIGLLQLNDNWPGRFSPEMIRFFEGLCVSIGIGLARIKAEEEIKDAARFPSENPYPVMRIAKDATVLYTNSAGGELLKEWGCRVGENVPENWHQYVLRVLKSGLKEELETSSGDKIFSLTVAPVTSSGYVNVYGSDITDRKQAEEDLREYREHLERLVQARTSELTETNEQLVQEIDRRKRLERDILDVSEREKRLIGQELHDSIGQQFTGIAFMTKVLEQKLARMLPEEAASVQAIAKLISQTTDQARSLAKGLHPLDLDADNLVPALQELAANTMHLFNIRCTFNCYGPVKAEDATTVVNLYRIAQESITNAIKHGKAKHVQLVLDTDRDKSFLRVISDGVDFPEDVGGRGAGMGLQIMSHRAEMISGSLDVCKGKQGGTVVTCVFPKAKH